MSWILLNKPLTPTHKAVYTKNYKMAFRDTKENKYLLYGHILQFSEDKI